MPRPLAFATLLLASTLAHATPAVEGRWITASGNLEVEVARCGAAWCGTVTRVIENRSMQRDAEMPATAPPALGMKVLYDLRPADGEPDRWDGTLFNRENGKTYRCRVRPDGAGGLSLRAYVGLPLFGQTQRWVRAVTE